MIINILNINLYKLTSGTLQENFKFLCILGGGTGTQSSEESPDSSEDDLYFGGTGFNSGERQSEQNRVSQHGQTVKSPITTLLGHSGVVISCGK